MIEIVDSVLRRCFSIVIAEHTILHAEDLPVLLIGLSICEYIRNDHAVENVVCCNVMNNTDRQIPFILAMDMISLSDSWCMNVKEITNSCTKE